MNDEERIQEMRVALIRMETLLVLTQAALVVLVGGFVLLCLP